MKMMPVVDSWDIFTFAEKKLGWSWNKCCDQFLRSEIIRYKEPSEFYLTDTESEVEYQKDDSKYERKAAYQCLVDFMKENNITSMLVKSG